MCLQFITVDLEDIAAHPVKYLNLDMHDHQHWQAAVVYHDM